MRDSLTVLAILLIVLLTGALVAPYFIDWNSHRALIEAKLSEAAGVRVAIGGHIDVKLLPEPIFRLGQVSVGSTAPGQQGVTADELDVEIALTALMRGEVQVVDATLRAPRLELTQAANGSLQFPVNAVADPRRVKLQHIAVVNGSLNVTDPRRGTWTLSGVDMQAEATSLLGPFKASGRFGNAKDAHQFRLSTGEFDGDKLRVKLGLDGSDSRPSAEFDGVLVTGRTSWAGGAPSLGQSKSPAGKVSVPASAASFTGSVALAGNVPLSAHGDKVPWSLTGRIAADRDKAEVSELDLRAGAEMRALIANGEASSTLNADPIVKVRLHGTQIDLDALAVRSDGAALPASKGSEAVSRLGTLATAAMSPAELPFRLDLDYGFDTATVGGLTLFGITGHLGLDGHKPAQVRFAASGPESARLALDGSFEAGSAPVYRGRLDASLRDLPRFADRLAIAMPAFAAAIKSTIPARAVSFGATVDVSGVGVAARDLNLSLDRTNMAGTVSYTRAVGTDRARLFADLSSESLDLDAVPDLRAATSYWRDLDLQLAVAARAVRMASAGSGAVDAGNIAFRLARSMGAVRLDQFSAELGSARLTATADLDPKTGHLQAHVQAPQLESLADLLARLWPGSPTTLLKERAGALSPADLDIKLEGSSANGGPLLPSALSVNGTANGTRISAQLSPDRPGDLDPASAVASVAITAEGANANLLLRQFGVPVAAGSGGSGAAIGAARVELKAHGSLANGFESMLGATIGDASLSFNGKGKPGIGSGHVSVKGADFGRLLRGIGLIPAGGSEAWPTEAGAELSWHDSTLAVRHLAGKIGGAAVSGDLSGDLSGPSATSKPALFGTLQIERMPASALFGIGLGTSSPASSAELWSSRPFGPTLLQLPRTEVAVKIAALQLSDALTARNASLTFRAEKGAVTLADLTGTLGGANDAASVDAGRGGSVGGTFTLRQDGPVAAISGVASWRDVALDVPGLAGRIGGTLDLAGSGTSPATLVASLAGSGGLTLAGGRIARLDPGAIARTAAAAEKTTSEMDAEQVRAMLVAELDRGALPIGDVSGQASLAAGVLRTGDLHADGGTWTADTRASLDLRTAELASGTTLRARQPLPDWKGEAPQITVNLNGPVTAPSRELDAAAFLNVLQSRAIARDQERIDVLQQDIRERAYFNRRLKAIEADQQAARDKAKADAEAARAKAKADAEAARVKAKAEDDAARAQAEAAARAQAEAANAKAQAEFEAQQLRAKIEADAARDRAKTAAEARAAAEIDRQIDQETSKTLDIAAPKSRAAPGASSRRSPPTRPGLSGLRVPTIVPRGKAGRSPSTPSIIQESAPDPLSQGRF